MEALTKMETTGRSKCHGQSSAPSSSDDGPMTHNGRRTTAIRQIVHADPPWARRQRGPMRQASCRFWEKAFTRLTHSEVLETLGLAFVAIIFRHRDLNPGRLGESRASWLAASVKPLPSAEKAASRHASWVGQPCYRKLEVPRGTLCSSAVGQLCAWLQG